jgi:hypothetical protein
MDQVPITTGILILACGFFLGFLCGWYFGFTSKPANFVAHETSSNFTPRAQQVLALARTEVDRLNHNFLGTQLDPNIEH